MYEKKYFCNKRILRAFVVASTKGHRKKKLFRPLVMPQMAGDYIMIIYKVYEKSVTSKGGSIGSTPACGPRHPSSNPAWG